MMDAGGYNTIITPTEPSLPEDVEFQDMEVVDDEPLALDERERRAIVMALERHKGNRRLAAQELRISERTLYRKIKEYHI